MNIFKKVLGREKDFKDIILIESNLNKESSTEKFLDSLCQKYGFLLHGSIHKIEDKIKSKDGKIFASNKAAIAIMRSLYSNAEVNLQYPYFINDKNPLMIEVHTQSNGKFTKKDKGFVYVVKSDGFKNNPEGSWQFVKEVQEINIVAVIETKSDDFLYPVKILNDYEPR